MFAGESALNPQLNDDLKRSIPMIDFSTKMILVVVARPLGERSRASASTNTRACRRRKFFRIPSSTTFMGSIVEFVSTANSVSPSDLTWTAGVAANE
jgi:hypothetical protein